MRSVEQIENWDIASAGAWLFSRVLIALSTLMALPFLAALYLSAL